MSLKNIYNPLLKYGLQKMTPDNTEVIETLSANYYATFDTPDNVKINNITSSGWQFVLPSEQHPTDKFINVYVDSNSSKPLTVRSGSVNTTIDAGSIARCYYSSKDNSWTVTSEAQKGALTSSFADYKLISANKGNGWYRVGQLHSTYNSDSKHVLSFQIFSESARSSNRLPMYAKCFYNMHHTNGGIFYALQYESWGDFFKAEHICSKLTGKRQTFASDIWIYLPNNNTYYFAIEVYGGTGVNKWSWAKNIWQGEQEYSATKPTGNIATCENKTHHPTKVSFFNHPTLTPSDNEIYTAEESITDMTVINNGNISYTVEFNTPVDSTEAELGTITFTNVKFNSIPVFGYNEHWIFAIRNGYAVWTKYNLS